MLVEWDDICKSATGWPFCPGIVNNDIISYLASGEKFKGMYYMSISTWGYDLINEVYNVSFILNSLEPGTWIDGSMLLRQGRLQMGPFRILQHYSAY